MAESGPTQPPSEVLPEFADMDAILKWLYPKLELVVRGEGYADFQQYMQAHGHWWWPQDAVYAAEELSETARKQRAGAMQPEFKGPFAPVFRFGVRHEWFARWLDRFADWYIPRWERWRSNA